MENTAKDQNKNNEIIITEKKRTKRNGGSLFSKKHTHRHTTNI
jgi:hypothetical protein